MQKKIEKWTVSEVNQILDKQRYPKEAEESLSMIAEEFQEDGLKWVLLKAYCLGFINGKRKERRRNQLK